MDIDRMELSFAECYATRGARLSPRLARHLHLVAAPLLGAVERGVGRPQERRRVAAVVRERRHTAADGERAQRLALAVGKAVLGDQPPDVLRRGLRLRGGALAQDEQELLTPEATQHEIGRA